jgi:hypothetical protein
MADAISIKFDPSGLNAALDLIAAEAKETTRPAAHAGAVVLYEEVKLNVSQLGKKTGNLEQSIYHVFSKEDSDETRATYHVSWNYKKAPHGHLVEYGYMQTRKVYVGSDGNWYTSKERLPTPRHVGAKPFLRPAFDAKQVEALLAARRRWVELNNQLIEGLQK